MNQQFKPKIYTALDFPTEQEAWDMFQALQPVNQYFKIGLELFCAAGPQFIHKLSSAGAKIFLDLKFHDIPNTVAQAVIRAASLKIEMLNIHIAGGEAMVRAVANLQLPKRPLLIGVTVLTSLDDHGLAAVGIQNSTQNQSLLLAQQAKSWGLDGVVCSAHELSSIRSACGTGFVTVVPGIRPANSPAQDQKRVMDPAAAAKAGAHYLVIGRPITQANDPAQALKGILDTI